VVIAWYVPWLGAFLCPTTPLPPTTNLPAATSMSLLLASHPRLLHLFVIVVIVAIILGFVVVVVVVLGFATRAALGAFDGLLVSVCVSRELSGRCPNAGLVWILEPYDRVEGMGVYSGGLASWTRVVVV
jgi:hypothetical protein